MTIVTLKPGVAPANPRRYPAPVTVNPVAGRENPMISRRNSAPTDAGAFFVPSIRLYGGCAWAGFGLAGFQVSRYSYPMHSCHPIP